MTEKETLADHAEAWWEDSGFTVPKRGSKEWWVMYEKWIDYAFSNEGIKVYQAMLETQFTTT